MGFWVLYRCNFSLSRHRKTQHCIFCEYCNKYVSSKHFHVANGKQNMENYVQVWIPCMVKPESLARIDKIETMKQFLNDFDNKLVIDQILSCMEKYSANDMTTKSIQDLLIDFDLSVFCLGIRFSSKTEEQETKNKVFNEIINKTNL